MRNAGDLVTAARHLARHAVGINELEMAKDAARQVFVAHGGNPAGDPVLVSCERCGTDQPCAAQSLAFSILLLAGVFEMGVESLTDQVVVEIGRRVKRGSL